MTIEEEEIKRGKKEKTERKKNKKSFTVGPI